MPLRTTLPDAPATGSFLRTAIVVYELSTVPASRSLTTQMESLLRTALDRLPMLPPARDTVLGLLILSLIPSCAGARLDYTPPDRYDAAARSLNMAYALGLDRAAERIVRVHPLDLAEPWRKQELDDARLVSSGRLITA